MKMFHSRRTWCEKGLVIYALECSVKGGYYHKLWLQWKNWSSKENSYSILTSQNVSKFSSQSKVSLAHSYSMVHNLCVIPGRGTFFLQPYLGLLWDPPSLLSKGYRGLFSSRKNSYNITWTIQLYLVPRWGMHGVTHLLPHTSSWCGVYLTRRTLPLPFFFMFHADFLLLWYLFL
jgi:hypothetical protein